MNMNMLNTILGPANQALTSNMKLLRDFQQYGISALQPQQSSLPLAPNLLANPNAMPANQALYLQSMMQQMTQMLAIMMQMGSILQGLRNSGINFKDFGITDEQLNFLDKTLPILHNNTTDNNPPDNGNGNATDSSQSGRYKAIGFLTQLLGKNEYETDAEDGDNDGHVVSAGDLAVLKAALDDELFDSTDLTKAFQYLLVKGDAAKLDELLALYDQAEKDGLVSAHDLLKIKFVTSLSDERQALIADIFAQRGLSNDDGKLNTRLVSFLIGSLAESADAKFNNFGRRVLQAMIDTWLTPEVDSSNPNRHQLIHLLNLAGFVLTPEGELDPEAEQPFSLAATV